MTVTSRKENTSGLSSCLSPNLWMSLTFFHSLLEIWRASTLKMRALSSHGVLRHCKKQDRWGCNDCDCKLIQPEKTCVCASAWVFFCDMLIKHINWEHKARCLMKPDEKGTSSISGWWFQTNFIFHFIYGMSSFPLTKSIIFQDGYCTTNQHYGG